MWYPLEDSIGYAYSTEGISWNQSYGAVLSPGANAAWERLSICTPTVIYNEQEQLYMMWYRGYPSYGGVQQYEYANS